ncbi:MAG: hypothetical protein HS111_21840 [Kofleriaceae bacterium]|nr:hypothetical protein [Kofleriaceae bacterium]
MFDRYNWDQGKSVTIAGITVRDEQLGRLHRVGLAREFDVEGSSTPHESSWTFTGAGAGATPEGQAPTGRDLAGGRADPTRERGLTPGRPSDGAPRGR